MKNVSPMLLYRLSGPGTRWKTLFIEKYEEFSGLEVVDDQVDFIAVQYEFCHFLNSLSGDELCYVRLHASY